VWTERVSLWQELVCIATAEKDIPLSSVRIVPIGMQGCNQEALVTHRGKGHFLSVQSIVQNDCIPISDYTCLSMILPMSVIASR